MVARAGAKPDDRLTFAVADLTSDEGWPEAVDGSRFVLHVASPYPPDEPAREDEVIVPARDGTLRVLRAARDASVKRVVLTSSFAAIGCGHGDVDRVFTEDDWTDLNGYGITAYVKSKVLAECAAWDFAKDEGDAVELSVVNPTTAIGPTLTEDISASQGPILTLLMAGEEPLLMANIRFSVADVRDVADIHLRAMTHPAAAGQRFIVCCDGSPITMRQAAHILHDWASVDAVMASAVVGEIGWPSNRKAKGLLGFSPRPIDETLLSTAGSLVRLGLVPTP